MTKPLLPAWIVNVPQIDAVGSPALETAAFTSGSALALLHMILHDAALDVPADLLRSRLGLKAAAACLKLEGRDDSEAAIRDAFLLTRAGDSKGPAGDHLALWSDACWLSLRNRGWQERLVAMLPAHCQLPALEWLDAMTETQGSPVSLAVFALRRVITAFPREEAIAFLFADVALARALGWPHLLPLMASYLRRKDWRGTADGLAFACHCAIARAANDATRLAYDLARRATRLRVVAPKLRAAGSQAAVQLFLTTDAILPSTMLSPKIRNTNIPMSDRAARRLCDRLVDLGVVHELTGRGTFRLYGL